jgi:ribosome-associated toxin RatA of RatAB toxin-antitoxin module
VPPRAVTLAVAFVLPIVAHAGGGQFSGEESRRLEAGEILTSTQPETGRSVPWMKASGLVDAPPEVVWPIIDDCGRYKDTMPRTVDSEELERHGNRVVCRAIGEMPFPFSNLVTETDAVHTIEPGRFYRREWKQRSGDFEVNEGRWTLEPRGDGSCTLATYEALTEPKIALPDFILRFGTHTVLPEMIAALREHAKAAVDVESRGRSSNCRRRPRTDSPNKRN